jgi:hypothetical protein
MDVENVSNGLRSKNMALAGSRNREHESVVSSASQVRCSDLTFTREVQQDCTQGTEWNMANGTRSTDSLLSTPAEVK